MGKIVYNTRYLANELSTIPLFTMGDMKLTFEDIQFMDKSIKNFIRKIGKLIHEAIPKDTWALDKALKVKMNADNSYTFYFEGLKTTSIQSNGQVKILNNFIDVNEYATYVHEIPDNYHEHPTRYKYFEDIAIENIPSYNIRNRKKITLDALITYNPMTLTIGIVENGFIGNLGIVMENREKASQQSDKLIKQMNDILNNKNVESMDVELLESGFEYMLANNRKKDAVKLYEESNISKSADELKPYFYETALRILNSKLNSK